MAHLMGKAAATCAVAGFLVLGGEISLPGQQNGFYAGPSAASAYVPRYRRYWRLPQYDTSGARIDRYALGWHGWPRSGAPANPCSLGKAQQNRC
jgi:hypothetical protein